MAKNKNYKVPHQKGAQAWINKMHTKGVKNKELEKTVGMWSNRSKKSVMEKDKLTEKQYRQKKSFLSTVYGLLTGSISWKNKSSNNSSNSINEASLKKINEDFLKKAKKWNDIANQNSVRSKECFYAIVNRDTYKTVADLQALYHRELSKSEIKKIYDDRVISLAKYNNTHGYDRYVPEDLPDYLIE